MATQTATLPARTAPSHDGVLLPAYTLWLREIVRFYRQRARVVGVIASPLLPASALPSVPARRPDRPTISITSFPAR